MHKKYIYAQILYNNILHTKIGMIYNVGNFTDEDRFPFIETLLILSENLFLGNLAIEEEEIEVFGGFLFANIKPGGRVDAFNCDIFPEREALFFFSILFESKVEDNEEG